MVFNRNYETFTRSNLPMLGLQITFSHKTQVRRNTGNDEWKANTRNLVGGRGTSQVLSLKSSHTVMGDCQLNSDLAPNFVGACKIRLKFV